MNKVKSGGRQVLVWEGALRRARKTDQEPREGDRWLRAYAHDDLRRKGQEYVTARDGSRFYPGLVERRWVRKDEECES